MSEPLVTLQISQFRRLFGVGMLGGLGIVLLYVAATSADRGTVGLIGLLIFGGLILWASFRMYNATAETLTLTREGIFSSTGQTICELENIASTDTGFFAFKPSNGFSILLKTPLKRGWCPGLWWRFGKRIGIGGVTSPGQGKAMSNMISMLLSPEGLKALDEMRDAQS